MNRFRSVSTEGRKRFARNSSGRNRSRISHATQPRPPRPRRTVRLTQKWQRDGKEREPRIIGNQADDSVRWELHCHPRSKVEGPNPGRNPGQSGKTDTKKTCFRRVSQKSKSKSRSKRGDQEGFGARDFMYDPVLGYPTDKPSGW